jgi:hypothetical protein
MKKAAVAVAHKILRLAYVMMRDGTRYREQGADYFAGSIPNAPGTH